MTKRLFDFFLALSGLLISLPIWFLFGILIWIEDENHIFYSQERVGKNGKIFKIIKFRSMVTNADKEVGPLQAKENDTRITRFGRILRATALDELPQLVNILKGEMSFVGPKALRMVEIDAGDKTPRSIWEFKGAEQRLSVMPGLTGVAQILAARDINRTEKFKYDIWYIKHQSFLLDLYIIFISFLVTFRGMWERRGNKFTYLLINFKKKVESEL
ncbi:MAG: sugar transferase [Candidatus Omnitrophica bacterium]|jgi:lipopolysaccharide/colanic/teichoic acid biosynthesis glycosyltransferase|nr:sugar transferase [Candidatus Omnitrophota bacterium]